MSRSRHAALIALYLGVACLITWPVILTPGAQFIGGDTSDVTEMARHIWWFQHALREGLPLYEQVNLGYPAGLSGVTLQANPLQFFPAWAFALILPLPLAYNLTVLLTMALNGWAMVLLMRHLLPERALIPALVAGLIFLAFPTMQGHLFDGHAGLLVMWPVPLLVLSLLRLMQSRHWRDFLLAVLFFVLSPAGHMLQVIYVLLPVMALFFLGRWWLRDVSGAAWVLGVGLTGGAVLLVYLGPVIAETLSTEAYTEVGGYVRYSADLLGVVSPSFENPVYEDALDYPRRVLGVNLAEGYTYLGLFGGILALLGVLGWKAARWWLALALTAWVLSLGPLLKIYDQAVTVSYGAYETFITLPFALVQNWPIFELARTPGRFTFTLALAVAVLAGYGMAALWPQRPSRWSYALLALLMLGILLDYQLDAPFPTISAQLPPAIEALSERDDVRAVFNLPSDHLLAAKDALYLQTAHEKALIAGQVSRQTPVNPAKLALLQTTLDPVLLRQYGADVVILHKRRAQSSGQLDALNARARQSLGAPFYEDERYALFNVPFIATEADQISVPLSDSDVLGALELAIYAPEPGWGRLALDVRGDERDLRLTLNGETLHRWTVNGVARLEALLPLAQDGFHLASVTLDPPCPAITPPSLACRVLALDAYALAWQERGVIYDPVTFAAGVELAGTDVSHDAANDALRVDLWWRFAEGRGADDRRFVHVLDANGRLVAQDDRPLGEHASNTQWSEVIHIPVSDLAPGVYRVLTGWYRFSDGVRLDVLEEVPGAINDTVEIGFVRLP